MSVECGQGVKLQRTPIKWSLPLTLLTLQILTTVLDMLIKKIIFLLIFSKVKVLKLSAL